MSEDGGGRTNVADGTAGIMAGGDVYDSVVYIVNPDDPPEKRYEVGVRHLEAGIPARARELIADARANGHDNSEVQFHWVLALLSKRAYRDLFPDEREQLARAEEDRDTLGDDEWTQALDVIYELVGCQRDRGRNPGSSLHELGSLGARQRAKIIRHLDHLLTGSLKDNLWAEAQQAASENRLRANRQGRVWAYFELDPIPPRARKPVPKITTLRDRILAVFWTVLFAASTGYLGWLVISHATPLLIIAYLFALAAGYVACRTGLKWRYRWQRLQVKDREHLGVRGLNRAPEGGFASKVDNYFDHYFATYVPQKINRADWIAETAGIKRSLRDEIVEVYREKRVKAGRVEWLIRHLASSVRQRWEKGTLWDYREQYRVSLRTKFSCSVSLAVLVAATLVVIIILAGTALLPTAATTPVLLLSEIQAARRWLDIVYERRRLPEDQREYEQKNLERDRAYQRWKEKLRSTRPLEEEMETWLNADMTVLLGTALKHYGLAWRDILAYAFLQTPSRGCQRGRVSTGHWRYSRYDVRLFLITRDGVRELGTELDFSKITFHGQERNNYRFDAVSSVHVVKRNEYSHKLKLTLTNGPSNEIHVAHLEVAHDEPVENPSMFATMNLEAAGFDHTLHILEGIAAEGKGWIDRDPHAQGESGDSPPETDAA
ncbi:hypothetical protein [Amycolatopsis taiwanensis]|uniref:Uncharacterized protein n=1 Tax=Amycolatopsis taiwanensis TaxID=342230 RepID=A0A9W6R7R9_9PSEU|nr:hypothetical protein [Amycolatopsis taiwanensis]GLY70939.1 hypothetical protein Atai01_75580 [Amycolatopsis taiwanensis]